MNQRWRSLLVNTCSHSLVVPKKSYLTTWSILNIWIPYLHLDVMGQSVNNTLQTPVRYANDFKMHLLQPSIQSECIVLHECILHFHHFLSSNTPPTTR